MSSRCVLCLLAELLESESNIRVIFIRVNVGLEKELLGLELI